MTTPSAVPPETALLATISLVLLTGIIVITLVTKLGQPPVVGEILAGIALGPSVLGMLPGNPVEVLFPPDIRPYLHAISQIGLMLFMFVTGWELDLGVLRRRARTIAFTSISSMLVPFGLGIGAALLLYPAHSDVDGQPVDRTAFLLYMGTALAVTALPVLARLLSDKAMHTSPLGTLALACAAAADVLAWSLLAVVVIIVQSSGPGSLVVALAGTALFVLACVFILRPMLAALVRRAAGGTSSLPLFIIVSAGVLLCSYTTSLLGVHAIFGAFVFGLVMPRTPADLLRRSVEVPARNTSTLLLPIFFIVTGLSVDITALGATGPADALLIFATACAGKLVGAVVPARLTGMSWRDSAGLGVLMNTRGLTELVILDIGRQLHIIDGPLFTLMTLMALSTTAMTAPFLTLLRLTPQQTETFTPVHTAPRA
ncbi:cation:proton antiporter domain-containing protein [Saccharopolyspora sp. NPDC003752]